jgi:hypothetical protein
VALILLSILFIPFHISFYLNKHEKDVGGYFQVRWLNINLLKRKIPPEKEKKEKKEKEEKKEKKKPKPNLDNIIEVLKNFTKSIEYLIPILCAFLKSIKLQKLSLNLNLGFSSPVNTAMFSGCFWSVSSILNLIPPLELSITPEFQGVRFDGSLEFELKITFYRIVGAIIKAITKKPVLQLFWSIRKLNQ